MQNYAASSVMTSLATVWPEDGVDQFGNITFGQPYTVRCSFTQNGKLAIDSDGKKFVPNSIFYSFDSRPRRGDKIVVGDMLTTSLQDSGAMEIRLVRTKTSFQGWQQRYTFLTG